jgi:Skp family chaperone for outer membrane proteins
MKKLLRKLVLGSLLITLLGGSAEAQSRIGTVDLRKVFDGYWKKKLADAALKERQADMDKEHASLVSDWKKAKEEYQTLLGSANDQTVSGEERDKRKQLAEGRFKQVKEMEETITQYERTARTTIEEQVRRMRENILAEIRSVLNAKAKSAGYTMVFDTAAESVSSTLVVVYTNNENDLTAAVLEQLNATAPPETPAAEEKQPEKKDSRKK